MPDTSATPDGTISVSAFNSLKARIHTYESFGRAVVEAALSQAQKAAASGTRSETTATVSIEPLAGATFSAASKAAGSAASGEVGTDFVVVICFSGHCISYGI